MAKAVIQMAFVYTCLVEESISDESISNMEQHENKRGRVKRYTVRRLRVHTVGVPRSSVPRNIMASANLDAVLLLLAHKVSYEKTVAGILEARLLLRDWLVRLTLSAAKNKPRLGAPGSSLLSAVHAEELLGDVLGMLAPYIFGLLLSPLLDDSSRRYELLANTNNRTLAHFAAPKSVFDGYHRIPKREEECSGALDWHAVAEAQLFAGTAADARKRAYPDLVAVLNLGLKHTTSDADFGGDSGKSQSGQAGEGERSGGSGEREQQRQQQQQNTQMECRWQQRVALARGTGRVLRSKEEVLWGRLLRLARGAVSIGSELRNGRGDLDGRQPKAFLLDTGAAMCLYYPWETMQQQTAGSGACSSDDGYDHGTFPFPPPHDCEVMRSIRRISAASRMRPSICICRAVRCIFLLVILSALFILFRTCQRLFLLLLREPQRLVTSKRASLKISLCHTPSGGGIMPNLRWQWQGTPWLRCGKDWADNK